MALINQLYFAPLTGAAIIAYICTLDFIAKMKFALMKLIWKSADLSSACADPDSCMAMRSQTDALYLRESIRALLFFLSQKMGMHAGHSQPEGIEI